MELYFIGFCLYCRIYAVTCVKSVGSRAEGSILKLTSCRGNLIQTLTMDIFGSTVKWNRLLNLSPDTKCVTGNGSEWNTNLIKWSIPEARGLKDYKQFIFILPSFVKTYLKAWTTLIL